MPSSPLDATNTTEAKDPEGVFRQSLVEIDQLIDSGVSLSGHERNCVFLNVPGDATDKRRFATASAAFGLDDADDARSPALVDWDRDGDLDLWVANRTAPMLRFYENRSVNVAAWLGLKLRGTTSNRDAIGARVTLRLSSGRPMSRTVRAGDGYLAQTSKWLHFGLGNGNESTVLAVDVYWPGGAKETFTGVAARKRWELVQGSGRATLASEEKSVLKTSGPFVPGAESGAVRALNASQWPLPHLPYTSFDGAPVSLGGPRSKPLLVNMWATWCAPCVAELQAFGKGKATFAKAGLDVIALSVDALKPGEGGVDPETFYKRLKLPFPAGNATAEFVRRLENAYALLYGPRWALPVPTSVLLDEKGQLIAFYKGAVEVPQVLADLKAARGKGDALHDATLPFAGRWLQRPTTLNPMGIALDLMKNGQVDAAYELAFQESERYRKSGEFAKLLIWLGDELIKQPSRTDDAIKAYTAALAEDDSNVLVLNNVAWQLAAHPDPKRRDGTAAVRWAEKAASLTASKDVAVLDTLAAAYAEAGRFKEAVATAEKASALAREQNQRALWEGVQKALQRYRAGQRP